MKRFLLREHLIAFDPLFMELEFDQSFHNGESVDHTPPETDLRCIGKITGLDGDLLYPQVMEHALGDDFRIENEVIRIQFELDRL